MATVFSLTAKINMALKNKKKSDSKKARLSAMHGIGDSDSDVNYSDYSAEESSEDSASD